MSNHIKMIFYDNPDLEEAITAFLVQDTEYVQTKRAFYDTAHEIAQVVGYDQYSLFEKRLHAYIARMSDLYYLFGLDLRQEVLQAMGAGQ